MLACVRNVADADTLLPVCTRLAPRIERHRDALVLDLGGCERLVLGRGEGASSFRLPSATVTGTALAASLWRQVRDASPGAETLRVGLGPTRTVAWLAAATTPQASWRAIEPSQVAAFLRPLPVGVLASLPDLGGVSGVAEALSALAQSGIGTPGQLVRLPASTLRRRFGPLGSTLTALAAGEDVAPFRVWRPAAWIGARLRLDPPVELAQLAPMLTPLTQHLATHLSQQHQVASALALVLQTESSATVRATRHLSHSIASAEALLNQAERLLTRLADHEPRVVYEAIHLRVGALRPASARQEVLWRSRDERNRRAARRRLFAPDGPLAGPPSCGSKLLHAALVSPYAVLPEDRYRFVPVVPPTTAVAA